MIRLRLGPRPPFPQPGPDPSVCVIATGSVGYLDASEDNRHRFVRGFRSLLDGLEGPFQVVIDFIPGSIGENGVQPSESALPPRSLRRARDLAFARRLGEQGPLQRREVRLVTSPASARAVRGALRELGVPELIAEERDRGPGPLLRREHAREVRDRSGWHRTWAVQRFPGVDLEPGWLLRLVPRGLRVSLAWHAERVPTDWMVGWLQRQRVNMRASQLQEAGGVGDPHLGGAMPAVEDLQRRLTAGEESAFQVGLYLTVSAPSREQLRECGRLVEGAARSTLCELVACDFRQLDGRLATQPLGRDPLRRRRVLDTSSLCTLFPWFDSDLQEPGGILFGASRATGQPVVVDVFDGRRYANANIGVFGHSGAGKTYLLSTLAMSALSLGTQVLVLDPEHEYGHLARRLGGIDVVLALGSGHSLNVLDVHGDTRDERIRGESIANAVDLCALICGGLDEAERAMLEGGVRSAFDVVERPLLADVARGLEAHSRARTVLDRWVRGELGGLFSRPTNIDLEAPMVVFGMRELRPELVAPVHHLLAEALWARIKRRERRRLLIVDELGLLFDDPAIRRFVVALARRIRKYDGGLVFATQNPGDLLSSEAGAVVATNPALHLFGAQRPGEAAKLQQVFQLSDAQRAGLESARRGEFLVAAGSARVPVRVHAPPWQAAAIDGARDPPA